MSRKASLRKRPIFWRCSSWPRGRGEYLLVLTLDDPNQRVFRNLAGFAPRTTPPIDQRPCSPVPASCKAWTSAEGPCGHNPQLKRVLGVPGSNPSRTWPCTQELDSPGSGKTETILSSPFSHLYWDDDYKTQISEGSPYTEPGGSRAEPQSPDFSSSALQAHLTGPLE